LHASTQACTPGCSFCAPPVMHSLGVHANVLRPDISTSSDNDKPLTVTLMRVCYYVVAVGQRAVIQHTRLVTMRNILTNASANYMSVVDQSLHFCRSLSCPECLVLHFSAPVVLHWTYGRLIACIQATARHKQSLLCWRRRGNA